MSRRIAFIGNMNNNHFSMMRYFRDLGIDAELLMYSNEPDHFRPQNDTWDWGRWAPYVRQLPFSNGGIDSLLVAPRRVRAAFAPYDVLVGNGISPVLCQRAGRNLDLFVPYGEGIEFIVEHYFSWRRPKAGAYSWLRKTMMEKALRSTVVLTVTANQHPVAQVPVRRLGLRAVQLAIPMLYVNRSASSPVALDTTISAGVERMKGSSLVVFSHVSHIWKNLPVPHFMGGCGKRNDWLIRGFAEYLAKSGNVNALLCFVDYGRDVPESKRLIEQLKIGRNVNWFPKMSRREIMAVLPWADIGGSEFAGMLWGGCGWEFLAAGVPMLHKLDNVEMYAPQAEPLPFFFNVNSPAEIASVLRTQDRDSLRRSGTESRKWFQKYQGQTLAKKFAELLGLQSSSPLTND